MSYPTGTTLKRRVPNPTDSAFDEIIVVGSERDGMSIQSNTEFSGVRPVTAQQVRAEYDTDVLPEGVELQAPGYTPVERSPEEIFADQQAKNPPPPDTGREALHRQAQEAVEAEAVRTQVQPTPAVTPTPDAAAVAAAEAEKAAEAAKALEAAKAVEDAEAAKVAEASAKAARAAKAAAKKGA